jgi:hypothetical protein
MSVLTAPRSRRLFHNVLPATFVMALIGFVAVVSGSSSIPWALTSGTKPFSLTTAVRQEALRWGNGNGTTTDVSFRYRADGVSTGSPCGTTSCGVTTVGNPAMSTVSRPAPFRNFEYTAFNGTTQAVLGSVPITTDTTLGFTVIAWFKVPSGNTEDAKLFSNTENNDGFALDVNNGYLAGTYSYEPSGSTTPDRHTYALTSGPTIDDGKWHEAAFDVARMPEGYPSGTDPTARARLYLDGKELGSDYLPATGKDFSFLDSTSLPAVGAEPNGNVPAANFFTGDINAVEVYNYPVDHNVLALAPPWDGDDVYGGLPSYHDYLTNPEAAGTPPDYYTNTWSFAQRFTYSDQVEPTTMPWTGTDLETAHVAIPMLNAGYVPQGVAVSGDGTQMYTMSYYAADADDPPPHTCPTQIYPWYALAVTDLTTLKVTGIYQLNFPGCHAGGIFVADGYVYTGYGTTIYRFSLNQATVLSAGDPSNNVPPIYALSFNASYTWSSTTYPDSSVSALAYDPAANEVYAMGNYQPEQGDNIDANDILQMPISTSGVIGGITNAYPVPLGESHNQGMTPIGATGGDECFLLSHSANYTDGVPTTDNAETSYLDTWCVGQTTVTTVATLAGGAENIALGPDGMIWVQSENSAHIYQKRTTNGPQYWDRLTPYIAGIPGASLHI